jgi:hypothetical protein
MSDLHSNTTRRRHIPTATITSVLGKLLSCLLQPFSGTMGLFLTMHTSDTTSAREYQSFRFNTAGF